MFEYSYKFKSSFPLRVKLSYNVKVKKILLSVFVAFSFIFLSSSEALARDNDHPDIPTCDIRVNGTSLTPNYTPNIYPTERTEEGFLYSIRACVSDPEYKIIADGCVSGGCQMKVGITNSGLFGWTPFVLDRIGDSTCFEGTFELDVSKATRKFDVEILNNSSSCGCEDKKPICQRVEANPQRILLDDKEACNQALETTDCYQNITATPTELIAGEQINFNVEINELLFDFDTCGYEYDYFTSITIRQDDGTELLRETDVQTGSNQISFTPGSPGRYEILLFLSYPDPEKNPSIRCSRGFFVGTEDEPGQLDPNPGGNFDRFQLCKQVPIDKGQAECESCFESGGIWTSLGCISNQDTEGIVDKILTIGISLAGGVALLIILAAAFILSTSQGEPKRTNEAKEMLTQAIIGLLFIIFSITILEFIGVKILRIPGFGE